MNALLEHFPPSSTNTAVGWPSPFGAPVDEWPLEDLPEDAPEEGASEED